MKARSEDANSKWWKDAVVYQIYPRSFMDSNGDGIGDIRGIISRLDYLKDLGVDVLWLSPVYRSPNDDNGYDISDYCDINPEYGTMADMDELIVKAKERKLKIVMDLVINHTSDEHPWFRIACEGDPHYRDYYFFRKGRNGKPPNNWTGFFGGIAWERTGNPDEWYLHLFSKKQPDLNYRNPAVLEEIKQIMRFWLDKGISGFRCDVINIIYKSSLENGRRKLILTGSEHYISQQGAHEILQTLRKDVLSHYDCFTVGETVFVTPSTARDLCDESRKELDMLFSFEHMETDQIVVKWFKRKFKPKRFFDILTKWQSELDWNANYLENHDQPRSVSRFGDADNYWEKSAKLLAVLLLSLRGTPYIYQGQELGMTNFDYSSMEDIRDVESKNIYSLAKKLLIPAGYRWKMISRTSRDNARTPMQWSDERNAGFSTGDPWLKLNKNYLRINAAVQARDPQSVLAFYKKMIALHAESEILRRGAFRELAIEDELFAFERSTGAQKLTVLLNFSPKQLHTKFIGEIVISNYDRIAHTDSSNPSSKVIFNGTLQPWEGVIIS